VASARFHGAMRGSTVLSDDSQLAEPWCIAEGLPAEESPRRWRHSQGVGRAATAIGRRATGDAALLARAATAQDVGYVARGGADRVSRA
jgi:hypothetical protein